MYIRLCSINYTHKHVIFESFYHWCMIFNLRCYMKRIAMKQNLILYQFISLLGDIRSYLISSIFVSGRIALSLVHDTFCRWYFACIYVSLSSKLILSSSFSEIFSFALGIAKLDMSFTISFFRYPNASLNISALWENLTFKHKLVISGDFVLPLHVKHTLQPYNS